LGELLSDCGIPAVGSVDADVLPASEKLSPAAPSTFTAAALVVRFCFEACLTGDMVASSVSSCEIAPQGALGETGAQGLPVPNAKHRIEFHSSHDRNRDITAFG
jgi:hypothetical protein